MYKRLFKYMKPYIWRYLLALLLMAIIVGVDIISPLLISLSLKELGNEVINFDKVIMYFIDSLLLIFKLSNKFTILCKQLRHVDNGQN